MPTSRIYTFHADMGDSTNETIVPAMNAVARLIEQHNRFVSDVGVHIVDGQLEIKLTMTGHDQWKIKQQVIYPLAALLSKAGMRVDQAKLSTVERHDRKNHLRGTTKPKAGAGSVEPAPAFDPQPA